MRSFFLTTFCLLFLAVSATGQVSQGVRPMDIPALKSRGIPKKVMPAVKNNELRKKAAERQHPESRLKPFEFAHAFNVDISPENEGLWVNNIRGYNVWQVKIHSEGAFSLNLIFEQFDLPQGARLFLFNQSEGHYLGAFTSQNNKPSGKFAVSPVAGDELTVQYEIPAEYPKKNDFIITRVNHDFTGILKNKERRPLGEAAGSCNLDINCGEGSDWKDVKDAVCRIIVNGREICTGTLVNNTGEDEKPYIISAAHCYDKWEYAETSVYTFNYESPYCAPLDGDPSNSVSGAVMKAQSDSLDFALTELTLVPPPEFRPYYAGWDKTGTIADSSTSIHHPQGDIKKISIDSDPPVFSSYPEDEYTSNGFIKILRWEKGVTEAGSSGGPLFNPGRNLIGTLTGGSASCSNPVNDYFSRFDMAWEFKSDSAKQLRHWLDPLNSNASILPGKRFYTDENLCLPFTNLADFDEHENVILTDGNQDAGYWGGTNSMGITGFAERFSVYGNEQLSGVSLGVGKIVLADYPSESEIRINVYNGESMPENLIYSEPVKINSLIADAMNFISFTETVEPADTFFVGFELNNVQPNDTFVVYQSLRQPERENFFWFNQNNVWHNFKTANSENFSMTNVFELVACNVDGLVTDTPLVRKPMQALIYPNPARRQFTFEAGQTFDQEDIRVFNLIGQEVEGKLFNHRDKKIQIDLSGNVPGVYFVRLKTAQGMVSKKVTYIP